MQEVNLITEIQDNSSLIKLYLDYFFDGGSKRNVKNLSEKELKEINKTAKLILKLLKKIIVK